jgi:hypothetical protein
LQGIEKLTPSLLRGWVYVPVIVNTLIQFQRMEARKYGQKHAISIMHLQTEQTPSRVTAHGAVSEYIID